MARPTQPEVDVAVDLGVDVDVDVDVDMVIIGGGIVGIYQLYRARQAGLTVRLIEAGGGVGGTWYWNRYPAARFDSESYTYAYLFSEELFNDWRWSEHFAAQPEIEQYINHVVDRFEIRGDIRLHTTVTSAVYHEPAGTWLVNTDDGATLRCRYVVAATGILSLPFFPDVPGRQTFAGESHHTGLWPTTPVDFHGKRVAVIGTGSSGVQLIPAIVDDVASLTVYQRSANWCTPLNNTPISDDEQAALCADFEAIRHTLNTSASGFLHVPHDRAAFDDSAEQRNAFFEAMWNSPGFTKLTSNYNDLFTNPKANALWCEFIIDKIRSIVRDPATVTKLIPDHPYAAKRPPFVNGYYEAYNEAHVSLVDLKAHPITQITATGIETDEGAHDVDIIVWATGFDFGTGTLNRLGVRGRDGLALERYWADGPSSYLGILCCGFPNFFFPGGPHGATGNNPRYAGDQVDFVMDVVGFMAEHDHDVVEVTAAAEQRWTDMVNTYASTSTFSESSYFFGSNIPGKPVRYLLNPGGRPKLQEMIRRSKSSGYDTLAFKSSYIHHRPTHGSDFRP